MKYEMTGGTAYPLVKLLLDKGETVKIERGSMAYKKDVEIVGKLNSNTKGFGALLGSIGRSLTSGESMFITEATGKSNNSEIGIAPSSIGKIEKLTVGSSQYRLNTNAYLASDASVSYKMVRQNISKAFFGGTGGLFVMETQGVGDLLIASFGDIIELEVTPNLPLTVDNNHVLAWSSDLDYNIEIASGTFGFTTGEGLVNTFRGSGKVLIQTRNIESLALDIAKFIPNNSN